LDGQQSLISAKAREAFAVAERYLHPAPVLAIISGPSGVGKDSTIKRMQELNCPFHFVVTVTDRAPRLGELHGVDYYFVSTSEFERMIAQGELFEHALVYGQHKGIPKIHVQQALSRGIDVIMRLDVQGAAAVHRLVPQAITIFLAPPSIDALIRRLRNRAGDSPQQVQQRLETALAEMERIHEFDYVVVNNNGDLDQTVRQIDAIITADKCRTIRSVIAIP
jgi:guanylate kinase